jgi:dipeptidyl aminopeptidase/acylaminoacyl peptidase
MKWRIVTVVAAAVLLAAVAVGYTLARPAPAVSETGVTLTEPGLLVRDTASGRLAVQHPDGTRTRTPLTCARVYAAAATGACLGEGQGSFQLVVLDSGLRELRTVPLNGIPNRVRVSGSGRMVSWTVFVTGDSYNGGEFSTRTGILDTRAGTLVANLETFTVQDGRPNQDANFWGVTFAADDNRFYATMSTGGRRYLMEGDFAARTLRRITDNVECPSLSPDGTRLAYKKMLPDRSWRLTVLSLADLKETPLAETRSVDDQAAWLDDRTVAYGLPHPGSGADVWTTPADGTGTPQLLAADAESPAILH